MTAYQVEFVRSARKEFERLPAKLRVRVVEALNILSQNPHSEFLRVKKLKGAEELYRIRIGDHRLVYEVRDERLVVIVVKIGHRRDVYRR